MKERFPLNNDEFYNIMKEKYGGAIDFDLIEDDSKKNYYIEGMRKFPLRFLYISQK